jgi:thiol-disulfide isomerase/thioredoxin
MLKFKNLFYLIATLSFVLLTNVACSNNDKDAANDPQTTEESQGRVEIASADTPAQTASDVPVYLIEGVGQPVSGKAVDFTWLDNGVSKQFSQVTKGKVVFLNFWGTWCPPCRKEIPDIIEISNDLKNDDFIIIGVAMERNPNDALKQVSNYVKSKAIPYMNVIANQEIIGAYGGVQAVPTTIIIDKNGNIAERIVGMREKAQFMQSINKVLK